MTLKNNKPKILIVDDDSISQIAIGGLLTGEPYDLYFASNGHDGIAEATTLHPDLILLDVMMPHMDGFEVCKRIRALPDIAEVPILLITSLDDQSSRIMGLQAGADDFISKPYNSVELFARLQTILRLDRYRRIAEQQRNLEKLNNELLIAYDKTIEGWSHALDLRDREVEGHTNRVTELALAFALKIGFTEEELVSVRRGGLLHDIGKLGIPDSILHKPDKLTDEEWIVMRMHPVYAYQWLSAIEFLLPALEIPYCHHEKWDGSGYPHGLKGGEIPIAARLFAFADVWDALCSDRPYRKALPAAEALEYIRSQSGFHFDPGLTETFIDLVQMQT
jgi:putative two-component system response regulator